MLRKTWFAWLMLSVCCIGYAYLTGVIIFKTKPSVKTVKVLTVTGEIPTSVVYKIDYVDCPDNMRKAYPSIREKDLRPAYTTSQEDLEFEAKYSSCIPDSLPVKDK